MIPPGIISNAKGLAIMTVVKGGFIWSGRLGTGVVIARLQDGSWSAPSAIGTAGVGFGGQIGGEITHFVIVLNSEAAVKAFALQGNVTLGGSMSVAAGPVGRTAEAAGTLGKLAPIFSYSKSKGLFVGVSLEGSVIAERKDANKRFYGRPVTAKELLAGAIERPAAAADLYRALDARAGTQSSILGSVQSTSSTSPTTSSLPPAYSESRSVPSRPSPPNRILVTALYDFTPQRPDDLGFKAGDSISVIKKTDNANDWWFGSLNGQTGSFPANYVSTPKQ